MIINYKKQAPFLLKIIFTSLVLFVVIKKIDFQNVYTTFTDPNPIYLFFSVLLMVPNFCIKFLKWHFLLKACDIHSSFHDASKSYLAGMAFGLVTPARAGEIGRAFFLNGQNRLKAAGVVMIDKVFDLIAIMIISLMGAKIFINQKLFVLLVFLIVVGLCVLFLSKYLNKWIEQLLPVHRLSKKIVKIFSAFNELSIPVLVVCLCSTLTMFVIVLIQCYTLTLTFHNMPIPFQAIIFAFPLVILANILPVTIGGLGIRESVAVFCLSIFDVPGEAAFTATFYLFVINVLFPAVIGYFVVIKSDNSQN